MGWLYIILGQMLCLVELEGERIILQPCFILVYCMWMHTTAIKERLGKTIPTYHDIKFPLGKRAKDVNKWPSELNPLFM